MPGTLKALACGDHFGDLQAFIHRIENFLRAGLDAHPDFRASGTLQGFHGLPRVIRSARD